MTPDNEKINDKVDIDLIDKAVDELFKVFDHVQIFVSRDEANGKKTTGLYAGKGNAYAIYGQVKLWTDEQYLPDKDKNNEG